MVDFVLSLNRPFIESLNNFSNIKNVQISYLSYSQNALHHPVTKLLKHAPLRPGLVRLAIFSVYRVPFTQNDLQEPTVSM